MILLHDGLLKHYEVNFVLLIVQLVLSRFFNFWMFVLKINFSFSDLLRVKYYGGHAEWFKEYPMMSANHP
jgi:hypothetical protein